MKHISETITVSLSSKSIDPKYHELRALQREREDAQAMFQMDKVRALDEQIEDLLETM